MNPFTYYNPCKLIYRPESLEVCVTEELKGYDKPLVVTSKGRKIPFMYEARFDVPSEPRLEDCVVPDRNFDVIIALGGGSVIDAAKVIACDKFDSQAKPDSALPIIAIPTTIGTGSEYNGGCVITVNGEKQVMSAWSLIPQVAILDPRLTMTLSIEKVLYGLIDAMSHIMEGGFEDSLFSSMIHTELIKCYTETVKNPTDLDVRGRCMWWSALANSGLTRMGRPKSTGIHDFAHKLGARLGIPHAQAISMTIPIMIN